MVILIDLDGTLVDTIKEKFKPYRDGLKEIDLSQVKIFPNVKEFITTQKLKVIELSLFLILILNT